MELNFAGLPVTVAGQRKKGDAMKRLMILCAASLLALVLAAPAVAEQHDHDHEVPEHPHAMLLDFELIDDGGTPFDPTDDVVSFDRCIDLANNGALPLQSHHHSLHTGTAGFGDPSVGITRAGHLVLPLHPFPNAPFADCAEIEAFVS